MLSKVKMEGGLRGDSVFSTYFSHGKQLQTVVTNVAEAMNMPQDFPELLHLTRMLVTMGFPPVGRVLGIPRLTPRSTYVLCLQGRGFCFYEWF